MTEPQTPPADVPAEKPRATLVGLRSKTIALDFPVEFDGKTYTEITVKRLTGDEVSAFYNDPSAERIPMFDCPPEVIDALDADDAEIVMEAFRNFLPRALRTALG